MLTLQNIAYLLPSKEQLFHHITFTVNTFEKVALIGNNGVGKSTLLRIIASELSATEGIIQHDQELYYIPQIVGQFNHLTVAQALKVADKIQALQEILEGRATEENFTILADDWTIEERTAAALAHWGLETIDLTQKLENLSGGQKTKVFLAGILIHQPTLVLMDEPSNHLDNEGRQMLYDFIESTKCTLFLVSHDRKLLDLLAKVCELSKNGIKTYGGNYSFYKAQKEMEAEALRHSIQYNEKSLRKAKEKERETIERQQKLDNRGKSKQEKAGVARIMMNTLRNSAENSTSKLKSAHVEKISSINEELQSLRSSVSAIDKMKFGLDSSTLHQGKILVTAERINIQYSYKNLWAQPLDLQIKSGERIAITGKNGTGKTSLLKVILGSILPAEGKITQLSSNMVYIDQDYSAIDNQLSVYQQAQTYNTAGLEEHEVKIRLHRFLFTKEEWDTPCVGLSGGERMRLLLCCLTMNNNAPDIIILDEPTNNLDIQNIEILTSAINEYQGTLLVVSHDETFLKQIQIERFITLF